MAANEDWHSTAFRQKVLQQIEEAVTIKRSRDPNVRMKNPGEMESQVYSKATTRVDYLAYVTRLLVCIQDIMPSAPGQQQAPTANMCFRQKVLQQIEEAVKRSRYPNVRMKNPGEMESQVYSRAKTRVEYLAYVARLLIYIRDKRTVTREGTLSDNDVVQLSNSIAEHWVKLGRRLNISDAKLDEIDARWPRFAEKAYRMLKCWKEENGSAATYRVLNGALCHESVNRTDLAKHICFALADVQESGMGSREASSVEDQPQSIPLYILARGNETKAAYQRALETGTTSDKRVKVMLIGQDRVGKTSVGRSLKGEEFRKNESSTEGVQMGIPLKQVGTKPWKNSTEEQEMTAFHHKCAQVISDHLLTVSSEGKALGKEEMTEMMTDEKELSVDDELHGPQEKKTATKDAAGPESYGNAKLEDDIHVPDKVTRLAIKNLSQKKSDNDDEIWPVIWDFAGQAIFRAIHPIFISMEAIYVLVLDLTKDLSAISQCCVKVPDHDQAEIPTPDSDDTNLDHIMRWMDLVHSFKHVESGKTLPPVILVGTHADLLQEDLGDKMMKIKDKIGDTARVFSDHIIGKTFPVNNTLAGKQEEDQKIVSLREKILEVGKGMPHTKVKVPLKWLQVENEVYDLASKGTNYITREDFKKNIYNEICQFEIEDDFEVLLHFLHDRGTVVYHGCANDKRSLVVLNPKWLVDILCQIITVEKQSEEDFKIHNHRKHLGRTGILHAELLDDSCERLKLNVIKDSLLDIMKKFNLLCEYTSKEGNSIYLVPCMLTSKPDDELNIPGNQEPPPVYITFNTQYVPGGLFSRLVVLFVKYAEIIHSVQPKLYANFARFFIGKFTGVEFVCYKRVIKVRVLDYSNSNSNPVEKEPKMCSELLSFLKISLKSLHEECHWLQAVSWDLCARCDLCPPEFASETTGECFWHGDKRCCHDDCAHYVSVTKELFCCSHTDGPNCCPPKTWCQAKALEDASRHNQDVCSSEVPDKEQPSIVGSKRQGTNQDTQATVPAKVARTETVVKEGTPSDDDLEELSNYIEKSWKKLGRRLKISEAKLVAIDTRWPELDDKAYQMLLCWKQENSSTATYRVLSKALCHEFVNRRDLAEKICLH